MRTIRNSKPFRNNDAEPSTDDLLDYLSKLVRKAEEEKSDTALISAHRVFEKILERIA